jgi:hypothetical protein
MTRMRQGLASRANNHPFRAKLSVEELEPRCLLSAKSFIGLDPGAFPFLFYAAALRRPAPAARA